MANSLEHLAYIYMPLWKAARIWCESIVTFEDRGHLRLL
jgi:hypothetical protein